ncbi:MAG TPA: hypothetical protein EYQ74_01225 [Planctomycetes bacterium]|nr:hypothetical protein [Planctomycetota bacterium]HIK60694.1 hypothetical protein [Planctomycetota bacterium]
MSPQSIPPPLQHLAPTPQRLEPLEGQWRLAAGAPIACGPQDTVSPEAWAWMERGLEEMGRRLDPGAPVRTLEWLLVDRLDGCPDKAPGPDGSAPCEAYRLTVHPGGIRMESTTGVGLFRATVTSLQLMRGAQDAAAADPGQPWTLPCLRIDDWPEFGRRGFLLDVSRDRVPLQERLRQLVRRCAELKLNHLELYSEHVFPYAGHEAVWRAASPITVPEWVELVQCAREVHVDLVPNQQTFGHMHRWLKHPQYRDMSEVPEGVEHAFAFDPEPFSLCPTDPRSLELIADLLNQLLPHFGSAFVGIGCDETFDIGQGRSREACAARGTHGVYLDYLSRVLELVRERGRRPLFWADVLLKDEQEVPHLPTNSVGLLWGYEGDHPFHEQAQRLQDSGTEYWICPGTSSWQSFTGRHSNMLANVSLAAEAGRQHGASGYLVTDWGDFGHWQPEAISWLGHVAGACQAWNPDATQGHLREQTRMHVIPSRSASLAESLEGLGGLVEVSGTSCRNATAWFMFLRRPTDGATPRNVRGLTAEGLAATEDRAEEIAGTLERLAVGAGPDSPASDLLWTTRMTQWACRLGRARLGAGDGIGDVGEAARQNLVSELRALVRRQAELWPRTSRPGGRHDSGERLERLGRWIVGGGTASL